MVPVERTGRGRLGEFEQTQDLDYKGGLYLSSTGPWGDLGQGEYGLGV